MHASALDIQTRLEDGTRRVSVVGELDLANAPELAGRIARLGGPASAPVEIDLSGVSFIDGSGLRVLLAAADALDPSGGPGLRLVNPSRSVRRLFELTGMSDRLGPAPPPEPPADARQPGPPRLA